MSFFEEENYPEGFKTESFKDFRRAVRQAFDDFAIGFKTMLVAVHSASTEDESGSAGDSEEEEPETTLYNFPNTATLTLILQSAATSSSVMGLSGV
jgi:hypothetical protein